MKTDQLIRALSADTQARPRFPGAAPLAVASWLAAAALVWLTLGFRNDLASSLGEPASALRFVLTGALAVIGTRQAIMLARPEGVRHVRPWPLVLTVCLALCVLGWATATTPADARQMAMVGKTLTTCLVTIPLLSIIPVTAILVTLRNGATTAPALAGLSAGVGGGGLAAMTYALHCTEVNALFYVTWYGLAVAGVSLIAMLIGATILRW
jgi:hypothetical protein